MKTFPGCTIRNTPSELIHCVVWAKHLFRYTKESIVFQYNIVQFSVAYCRVFWVTFIFPCSQLFGEPDADNDVSPDTELESNESQWWWCCVCNCVLICVDGEHELQHSKSNNVENVKKLSTRQWAESNDYRPDLIFQKVNMADKLTFHSYMYHLQYTLYHEWWSSFSLTFIIYLQWTNYGR